MWLTRVLQSAKPAALAVFTNCPWVRTPLRRHELPKLHTAQRQDTGPSSDQLVLQWAEAWAEHTSKEPLATGAERFVTQGKFKNQLVRVAEQTTLAPTEKQADL